MRVPVEIDAVRRAFALGWVGELGKQSAIRRNEGEIGTGLAREAERRFDHQEPARADRRAIERQFREITRVVGERVAVQCNRYVGTGFQISIQSSMPAAGAAANSVIRSASGSPSTVTAVVAKTVAQSLVASST